MVRGSAMMIHPSFYTRKCLRGLVERSITGENLIAENPSATSDQRSILQLHPPGNEQEELPFSVMGKLLRAARAFVTNPWKPPSTSLSALACVMTTPLLTSPIRTGRCASTAGWEQRGPARMCDGGDPVP